MATGLNADAWTRVHRRAGGGGDRGHQRGGGCNQTAQVTDTGVLSKARGGSGRPRLEAPLTTFAKDVSACLPTATLQGAAGGQISVAQPSATVVRVTTRDTTGTLDDGAFSLLVTC